MFNFEKIKQSINNKPEEISKSIRDMRNIDNKRTSILPNPIDDTIEKTEKFWDKVGRGVYDEHEVIELHPDSFNSRKKDSEKAA